MTTNDVMDEGSDRYNVPALERGLRVLCEFSRENRTLSAPELARRFDLPRSTVFRLLSTLENMGFVEKTDGGRDYRLGLAVLRLGFEYLASLELTQLGIPLLQRLSDDLRTPCNLVVRDGRFIVYVAKVAPPSPFISRSRWARACPRMPRCSAASCWKTSRCRNCARCTRKTSWKSSRRTRRRR